MKDSFYYRRWKEANIPAQYLGMYFSECPAQHWTGSNALDKAKNFVETISDRSPIEASLNINRNLIGKGILFHGPNGTGKTTLASAILTEVQHAKPAYSIYYVKFSVWQSALTDSFERDNVELVQRAQMILHKASNSHVVVLDDIGQEHRSSSGFTERKLHDFLRTRYESAKPTILTTNMDSNHLLSAYGESFDSFKNQAFDICLMSGKDMRKV